MTDPAAPSAPSAPADSTTPHPPGPGDAAPRGTAPGDPTGHVPPGPVGPPRPDLLASARSLRRSRDDRVVAGVLGGIAPRLGVDPLMLRIVVAVLALFGVGVGLYAIAWLLIPVEGEAGSVGEQALGRGRPARAGTVVLALTLLILALLALTASFGGGWAAPPLLVLALVGAALLLRRTPDRPSSTALPPSPAGPPAPSTGAEPGTPAVWTGAEPGAPVAWTGGSAAPAAWSGGDLPPLAPDPPGVVAPRPPRPRSRLLSLTLSAALVAVGLLAVVDVAGADVPWGGYWALALAVVGAGLVLGAWAGRSRGLIAVGVVLALGAGASLVDVEGGDFRRTSERITTVPPGGLSVDAPNGEATYDLRGLQLLGQDRTVEIDHGVGRLVVQLPAGLDVDVAAEAGLGEVDVLGQREGGPDSSLSVQDVGTDGPGGGTLRLDVSTGVGSLEVRRG